MTPIRRPAITFASVCVCVLATLANAGIASAQGAAEPRAVRVSIGPGSIGRYERGRWSVVTINATNSGQEAAEANVSVFLEDDSRTQFTRRFWLPAGSSRKTWLPILPPADIPSVENSLHVSRLNVVDSANGAILSRAEGEQLISESPLTLDPNGMHMGMIAGRALPGAEEFLSPRDDQAYDTVVEVRLLHDGDRKVMYFSEHLLPACPEAYDGMDQLVICTDRLAIDSGGIAALRDWMARGGRAWIMLDLAGMDAVRTLLGNATPCEIVDRVELTEFAFNTPGAAVVGGRAIEPWDAEEPVEFVRVLVDSGVVHSTIDGWPAAFSIPFGDGQVLITTLAARGWRYQFDEFAERSGPARPTSGPTDALRNLASEFNQLRSSQFELSDEIRPVLSEQIGYRVPSRSVAALILGLNCGVIVMAGVWLARRGRLEHIAWVVPAATAVSATVLIMIGSANTSSIPATSSILRLASVSPATNEIHADTLAVFYSPETVALPLQVDLAGIVMPDVQDLAGTAKRAVWDDDGRCGWEQVDVASGSVRFVRAKESRLLASPLRAPARFGPQGLTGRIIGMDQIATQSDAILAAPPAPNSGVKIDATGTFQAGPDDILSRTEFVSGTMLSDQQQRRQAIYRKILAPREGAAYPQRPTLLVWGDSHSFGLTTPDLFQQSGATLYALPLDIGRTPAKQPFLVPPTFIQITSAGMKAGASKVYNPRTGAWLEDVTAPTQSFFRFLLPREVVPCQVQRVEIKLKIHAPSRSVELVGWRDGQMVTLDTYASPRGVLEFEIDDPRLLQLDESGGLRFGVTVSPTPTQVAANEAEEARRLLPREPIDPEKKKKLGRFEPWQIDYLHLQASGETM